MNMRSIALFAAVLISVSVSMGKAGAENPEKFDLILYVDAVKGDDANDATSEKKAMKSLNAAQVKIDMAPIGAKILLNLARGSVWREERIDNNFKAMGRKRPEMNFGRQGITVRAYGEGDKPTISGLDILSNEKFVRHDPDRYPAVWSQTVMPPSSFYVKQSDGYQISYPGILVDGKWQLSAVYPPVPKETGRKLANYPDSSPAGINNETEALQYMQEHIGTYYYRYNDDGSYTYFINSGTDPTRDGRHYEHRVRGSFFIVADNRWEAIRHVGMNRRNGLEGTPRLLKDVEISFGGIHNMIMKQGRFEGMLSETPPAKEGLWYYPATAFHGHGSDAGSLVYDKCTARNASIGFFDHAADARRPFTILRDCTTENIRDILSQGHPSGVYCSEKAYIVGHRHQYPSAEPMGFLGDLAGRNYIEDSLLRLRPEGLGSWNSRNAYLRMRNSVIYTTPGYLIHRLPKGTDYEYEYVTLIIDYRGKDMTAQNGRVDSSGRMAADVTVGTVRMKNCIIAFINAPNMKEEADGKGLAARLFPSGRDMPSADFIFENCVMTYMEGIPESAGAAGKGYVFASSADIFAGDPGKGDYTINKGGPADKADAGYRVGRAPVYRIEADRLAATIPY